MIFFKYKSKYFNSIIVFGFLVFGINIYSQENACESTAQKVYNTLINSIGNNFPAPPKLMFSDKEKSVASISNGNIILEKKALKILCSFSDSEGAMAYVLSHELAHHYLSHSWMHKSGLSYVTSIGEFISEKSEGYEQRKIEETQADSFGGFFSQISGYQSLSNAPNVLREIYSQYNLPLELKGYPSFDERVAIIEANLEKVNKLNLIFEVANLNIIKGDYLLAEKCYLHILSKNFTSREIYNNLGSIYLNIAINNFDEEISKFIYPIFYENNSRTEIYMTNDGTRDINDISINPNEQLEKAIDMFKRSISTDADFVPAKVNLILSEMIKNKIEGNYTQGLTSNSLKKIDNLNYETYYDITILNNLFFSNKKQKSKKLLKFGSNISTFNYEKKFHSDDVLIVNNTVIPEKYSKINIEGVKKKGLAKPYEYVSSGKGIKVKMKRYEKVNVYEINYLNYFLEIKNRDYSTSKEIQIGDSISKVTGEYGIPDEIIKFGECLYYSYRKFKIAFSTKNEKILKIIIYT